MLVSAVDWNSTLEVRRDVQNTLELALQSPAPQRELLSTIECGAH